jgi:hypothetical protein
VASGCRGGNSKGNALPLGRIAALINVFFFTYPSFSESENHKNRNSIDGYRHF